MASGRSVVRITSFGCGGVVSGSGFVIKPRLIITNAHVIAGVARPIIKTGTASFAAVPVLFDPNQDIAILKVSGLSLPPIKLAPEHPADGYSFYIAGYPESIYTIDSGIVLSHQPLSGSNIYGLGAITRSAYTFKGYVAAGSSGSPLLTASGQYFGIVFAKSNGLNSVGYGLSAGILSNEVARLGHSNSKVSTGVCYQ